MNKRIWHIARYAAGNRKRIVALEEENKKLDQRLRSIEDYLDYKDHMDTIESVRPR